MKKLQLPPIQLKVTELFEPNHSLAWPYLCEQEYPWEILDRIGDVILAIGETLDPEKYHHPSDGVWIAKSAKIVQSAAIGAPVIIGEDAQIRHGAFIRGNVLIGDGCVVGNSVELKNCILFDGAQAPHFNYVGDSVLGYKAHMGAGAVTSNVKGDRTPVCIKPGADSVIETSRRKVGAFLGDYAEVGCNTVLAPGCVLGRNSMIYPTSLVRGVIPPSTIFKSGMDSEIVPRVVKKS